VACLAQHDAQPSTDKVESIAQGFLGDGHGEQLTGSAQASAQVKADLTTHERLHHAQGRPPQAKGIRRAAGLEANDKKTHQTIQPVGQTDGHARRCLGQGVAREAGQVVLAHRRRHDR
jgi:hypothetical protein